MPTNNQNLPVRQYIKQYVKILGTVFNARKSFSGAFAPIQMLDGVSENAVAFSVKTCNTPVVVGTYDTDTNMGAGSRFGSITEVKYSDTDVPYDYTLAIHEGLDRFTVNAGLDKAVADRLKLQSEAQVRKMNVRNGKFLSDNAQRSVTLTALSDTDILSLFDNMATYYINNEIEVPITAYVRSELFNAIVDASTTSTSKGSRVNIDRNTIEDFKGFKIEKVPAKYLQPDEIAYFAPDGICIPFVGISTGRTIEATEFDGVQLQAAGKGGTFVLDDNKQAIAKVLYAASKTTAVTDS